MVRRRLDARNVRDLESGAGRKKRHRLYSVPRGLVQSGALSIAGGAFVITWREYCCVCASMLAPLRFSP
jgi:alpha-D-ribose 1-methylphosphonate 5-phosphate C-P lyase